MSANVSSARITGWVIDAVAFVATVSWMRWQAWTAGDMVWSLWIASLCVGFTCFVAAFISLLARSIIGDHLSTGIRHVIVALSGVLVWLVLSQRSVDALVMAGLVIAAGLALLMFEVDRETWSPAKLVASLVGGLFFLGFFTVHFGGFHAVHAVFLNSFFPLVPEAESDPFAALPTLIDTAAHHYPVMIAVAVIVQWKDLSAAPNPPQAMVTPYGTVVRLHLTILAIGFLQAGGLAFWVNYLVLAIYFIPFGDLVRLRGRADSDRDVEGSTQ